MKRVLKELRRVRKTADADAVHELRVAIRRCRSVATLMVEVDGHPAWRAMKRLPRNLFRVLGALRDLQVLEAWVKQLAAPDDPLRGRLLGVLEEGQQKPRGDLRRALRAFDREGWERLGRKAPRRAFAVTPDSLTAQCLALERYEELLRLHERAVHADTAATWHELRLGLKRFGYAVDVLLPQRFAVWGTRLGQIKDLLGEVHDLDVLRSRITNESDGFDASTAESLRHLISVKRHGCIERYRKYTRGTASVLGEWRAGLPQGTMIGAATAARFRSTARAMDRHPRRTKEIVRLAMLLFERLAQADRRYRDSALATVLLTASQLHGIDTGDRERARHKAARDFLRATQRPPGWTSGNWDLVAHVVRYQRGAEPSRTHRMFARLSPRDQSRVRGLAGILRLARGLHRCGVGVAGVRVETAAAYVRIRVTGLADSEKHETRLAAAKHLLERYLRRPVLIERMKVMTRVPGLRLVHSARYRVPAVAAVGHLMHARLGTQSHEAIMP